MARLRSLLAASLLAALVGSVTARPVQAAASITPVPLVYTVGRGGSVAITGTTATTGIYTGAVVVTGLPAGLSFASLPLPNPILTTISASNTAPLGLYTVNLSFTSTGGNPTAQIDILVTEVPEPGAVTFGVIAAGSLLGLVARRRKVA